MPIAIPTEQLALQASIREWAKQAGTIAWVRGLEPAPPPGGPRGWPPGGARGWQPGGARGWQPGGPAGQAPWDDCWRGLAGLGIFSIALPAEVGGAGAAAYARTRHQFGRPIGSFQAVKHLSAGMLCRAERAIALAWDAARALDEAPGEHPLAAAAAAAAAALALDDAVDNAKDCIQVLGPDGATSDGAAEDAVHEFLLTRCLSIAGGTSQILLSVVAERALGLPREEMR